MVRLALVLLLGRSRVLRVFASAALGLVGGACIWVFRSVRVEAIGSHADSLAIQTPVKAHLRDGSTVLYRGGVLLAHDTLRGPGVRYGVTLRDSSALSVVPRDSVVAMESFRRVTNGAPTVIVSTLATGAGVLAAAVAAFVIVCSSRDCWGNCPTVYADSVALVLRLRNSLLATLLYSDVMLGGRGARSLDWIGRDLDGGGAALAHWQEQRMGMRVAIWDGRRYHETARIRDSGPHAWNDVAGLIPVLQRDSVRVRLSFPADNWRIDRVVFAMRARRPVVQTHAFDRLVDAAGRDDSSALASVRLADERYLRTSPGERFIAVADVGEA